MDPEKLTEHALELIAGKFKALSESARLRLILALKEGEKNVSTLVDETGLGQANTSRHLQLLLDVGIVGRRKEGLHVYYFIQDKNIFSLCSQVCGSLEKHHTRRARSFKA